MTVRIVSEQELRDALARNEGLAKGRESVLTELEALRDWCRYVEARRTGKPVEGLDPEFVDALDLDGIRYPLERLDEIESEIRSWPEPVTREELG